MLNNSINVLEGEVDKTEDKEIFLTIECDVKHYCLVCSFQQNVFLHSTALLSN